MKFYRIHSSENISICHKAKIIICDLNAYTYKPKFKKEINFEKRIQEIKHLKSLLLIYTEDDNWTPISMGKRLKHNCPVPTELWTVKDAQHAKIMKSIHKAEYQDKIIEYFDSHIK